LGRHSDLVVMSELHFLLATKTGGGCVSQGVQILPRKTDLVSFQLTQPPFGGDRICP